MYKKILVPIDLADLERGKASLAIAKNVGDEGCEITLLNIVEEIPAYVATELPSGLLDQTFADSKATLETLAEEEGGCTAEVRHGRAHPTILAEADKMGADLIIVGSHKPGIQDYLLGSTAAKVVRHSSCSVLVSR